MMWRHGHFRQGQLLGWKHLKFGIIVECWKYHEQNTKIVEKHYEC